MKKLSICLAALALLLAGCSKDEVTEVNQQNLNIISFSSTTTRAAINTLASIEGSTVGFEVYATNPASIIASAWFTGVDGTENYRYNSGNWGWTSSGNPTWPTTAAGYPMNFYAMYPEDGATLYTYSSIQRAVVIAATAATQVDLLAAKATANGKPGDGRLPLTFNHILSKVNFGIIAGNAKTAIVQEAGVQNVYSAATYDYVAETWGARATDADYEYFKNLTTPLSAAGSSTEDAVIPFYTGTPASTAHLMLMPQTHDAWIPVSGTAASDSYASLTYRLKAGTDDEIGYSNATGYLADYSTASIAGWGSAPAFTGIGTAGGEYNGALFVKAGFPLGATDFTWAIGKGYTYNICLGTLNSSNGYYTETTYFDEYGQDTGIPIIGPKGTQVEEGDPVSDGIIHFRVNVSDWVDELPTELP